MSISTVSSGEPGRVADRRPAMLLIAGFGDDASMYDGLLKTPLANSYDLLPLNLPGFGAPALQQETTLQSLAEFVSAQAKASTAEFIVAHSVASIIATLTATEPDSPITTIVSLEGNLTADDAYFSGTAADYDDPHTFKSAFLKRLEKMSHTDPMIARYRKIVAQADPLALWQLGNDAHHFSIRYTPGELLVSAAKVVYLYNPDNCPKASLEWLTTNPIERRTLKNAGHWVSVEQPEMLAENILLALD